MSARDVLAMALVRHIEGDSVTRDLITDDEWAGYLSDADYVSGLIAAAGYAVVPMEATQRMVQAAAQLDFAAQHDPTWPEYYRAMITASEPTP